MRVWDARKRIRHALRDLDYERYLVAMLILCDELRVLYADSAASEESFLVESSLDLIRERVVAGANQTVTKIATQLIRQWELFSIKKEDYASSGQLNMWMTFESLVGEMAGTEPRYAAAERVTKAAVECWTISTGRARKVDPEEKVDDSSPLAVVLDRFERIAVDISRIDEINQSPEAIRIKILRATPGRN